MNKTKDCILTIDAGTQAIRAVLFDLSGNIFDIEKTPIQPYFSVKPGWAEQEPEYFWEQLCKTCRHLFKKTKVNKKAIWGMSVTTQRQTVINLDKNGYPLRPAIIWLDQRKARNHKKWPPFYLKPALKALNLLDTVYYTIMEAEANWLMQNQPEIWDATHKYLFLSGYLAYKLTGEYIDSTGNQVGYMPFDYKNQSWAAPNHNYWKRIPIEKEKLPELAKPTEILGYVNPKASKETGIPIGLPIIASANDKACEVLGSGCITPEIACLSYGTTATVETTNKKYVEIIPFIPSFPSAVPGAYNTEVMITRGYWMISWFKEEFGFREVQKAKRKNIDPEMLFDDLIKDIPPGSMGLMLQPYWSPGIKVPGFEAKGAVIGFNDAHTRAHFYKAIIEGLCYALKEGTAKTEFRNGIKIEKLRVSGGGSQSSAAMQMTADIFDLPAERPHTFETSALGAAIDAAVGLKLYESFETAIANMTRIRDVFEPVPEVRDIYRDLYEKVYKKIYKRLKPLYMHIRDITNHPPPIK